ncbi:ABC transporter ATP-binding protein [Vagococcus sp. DIV0080]|uniref:ABC transporter ATP-binding protein n=1 Tax=Candidatus Vagococcus giribetii TaxID=2230876 RepID=A0ABS3HVD2_9ENTE|nr:ABC transporter ATP-binding protein [Vagococcus sp. DIV0080]MBO0477714.1 ABC transporter ATP-binding protein [Vagococcus sp. DIV0080]
MAIEIRGMSKTADELLVLNDIDLTFQEKKIYGLLGQNDSGKTTLMRLIAHLRFPSEGYIEIDGIDIEDDQDVLKQVYFLTHDHIYPKRARLKHIVKWMGMFYPNFQTEECLLLLEKYHLNEKAIFSKLPLKKKTLFQSCLAFSNDVDYLLLDEPVFGLDAYHRHALYQDMLASYDRYPKTIILSTHGIDEIEELIERVVILEDGQVLINDEVKSLIKRAYSVKGPEKEVREFLQKKEILGQEYRRGIIKAYVQLEADDIIDDKHLEIKSLNLQELFIQLTRDVYGERGDK